MGEPFLSASLSALSDKLASSSSVVLSDDLGMHDEFAKLQRALKRLVATLHDAEQKKVVGKSFTLWLQELKTLGYDAEDVVDEFEYEGLRREVENDNQDDGRPNTILLIILQLLSKFLPCLTTHQISFRDRMAHKIDGIWRRLDEISKFKRDLDLGGGIFDVGVDQPADESRRQMIRETSSLLVDPDVFGRDEVKNNLIRMLIGESDTNDGSASSSTSSVFHGRSFAAISIVGIGGLGKTTLAQLVYNDKRVQEHFDLRWWVFVSPDFNLKKLTKQILEHIGDPQFGHQNIDNLNVLQENLSKMLKGKSFLLILDDVWEEDPKIWQEYFAPLTQGAKGSKVLVTTRNATVAKSMRSEKIQLEGLSFDDCWAIFRKHAFPAGTSGDHSCLESIGKEIVQRLMGVPLAATTIGGLLGSELEESKWIEILQSELWELKDDGEGIFPALKVSFEYLPYHLKPCFAYCSVFMKGQEFDMLELVQLWMAQGYVPPQGRRLMEDVGMDYLNELVHRSLLQFVNGKCVIHDLLHDLGKQILQDDFYKIGPDPIYKIPEDAHFRRHLLLHYNRSLYGKLEVLHKFSSLRTFEVLVSYVKKEEFLIPDKLFVNLKCLRVLELSYCHIETLPDSIGHLKHLRYVDLSNTPIKYLPDSLCALYNLQTLKLGGCDQLNMLPKHMSRLINLRHLQAEPELVSKITKIWKLKHLQSLEVFSISDENGNKIGNLKYMNELRGKLCIQNLQKVESREEAFEAALVSKQYLEKLELEWADDQDVDQINNHHQESVIEGLQPPSQLKELILKHYASINCPRWMYSTSSISSLESFHTYRCINLSRFPPLQQLHLLKTLDITSCSQLKELPHLPPQLRSLILRDVGLTALPNNLHDLPLQQLVLCQILELKKLPLLPATLKELTLEGVGLHHLPELHLHFDQLSTAISGVDGECECGENEKPMISTLKIHDCPHLTTLDEGLLKHHLRHLQVLSIKDCMELVKWPQGEGFRATLCLLKEELTIKRCPKLEDFPEDSKLLPSLKKVVVKACPGVPNKSLFSQVHNFSSVDVFIENWYHNLAHCVDEALQHIMVVDWLAIEYQDEDVKQDYVTAELEESSSPSLQPISFVYHRGRVKVWSWEEKKACMYPGVQLVIKGSQRRRPVDHAASVVCDSHQKLLRRCLRDHAWTSSLRQLTLDGIFDDTALITSSSSVHRHVGQGSGGVFGEDAEALLLSGRLPLPSLQNLSIKNCEKMSRLPVETLLSHLTALKDLQIDNCPELTWKSVEEGIRSVPSLLVLRIFRCPGLLMPLSSLLLNNSDGDDALSVPPPPPLPPPLPVLQYLFIDDAQLLTHLLLVNNGHLLTSLRYLLICISELTSLTAEGEDGLRSLASSLQCLGFSNCPRLQNLPTDLRGLLPNLKVLAIDNCPDVQCLPDGGLPDSLEFLHIDGCPTLAEWCHRARPATHLPLLGINKVLQQGSYLKFLELKDNWDFVLH